MSAVVLNMCREFRRRNCSKSVFAKPLQEDLNDLSLSHRQETTNKDIWISSEVKRLNQVLSMFGSKSEKLILALKVYFGLKLNTGVIDNYLKNPSRSEYFLESYNKIQASKKQSRLSFLSSIFNEAELKTSAEDATRKWVNRSVVAVLKLLNTGKRMHTKETLTILLELRDINTDNE